MTDFSEVFVGVEEILGLIISIIVIMIDFIQLFFTKIMAVILVWGIVVSAVYIFFNVISAIIKRTVVK